jgi:Enoyl-(Acyl carrier protein) reductase
MNSFSLAKSMTQNTCQLLNENDFNGLWPDAKKRPVSRKVLRQLSIIPAADRPLTHGKSVGLSGTRTGPHGKKMGLVGFARGLASEFAAHNIRVNVVSPGSIDTMRANPEWYQGRTPSAAGIPLGRQGTVDEIAATCLFLVSDDGGFITGQTIHVNGGSAYY